MATKITNKLIDAQPIPAPFSIMLSGGASAVFGGTPAQIRALVPSITDGFLLTDLPNLANNAPGVTPLPSAGSWHTTFDAYMSPFASGIYNFDPAVDRTITGDELVRAISIGTGNAAGPFTWTMPTLAQLDAAIAAANAGQPVTTSPVGRTLFIENSSSFDLTVLGSVDFGNGQSQVIPAGQRALMIWGNPAFVLDNGVPSPGPNQGYLLFPSGGSSPGGGVTAVNANSPLSSTGGPTPTIAIQAATNAQAGSMSPTQVQELEALVAAASVPQFGDLLVSAYVNSDNTILAVYAHPAITFSPGPHSPNSGVYDLQINGLGNINMSYQVTPGPLAPQMVWAARQINGQQFQVVCDSIPAGAPVDASFYLNVWYLP